MHNDTRRAVLADVGESVMTAIMRMRQSELSAYDIWKRWLREILRNVAGERDAFQREVSRLDRDLAMIARMGLAWRRAFGDVYMFLRGRKQIFIADSDLECRLGKALIAGLADSAREASQSLRVLRGYEQVNDYVSAVMSGFEYLLQVVRSEVCDPDFVPIPVSHQAGQDKVVVLITGLNEKVSSIIKKEPGQWNLLMRGMILLDPEFVKEIAHSGAAATTINQELDSVHGFQEAQALIVRHIRIWMAAGDVSAKGQREWQKIKRSIRAFVDADRGGQMLTLAADTKVSQWISEAKEALLEIESTIDGYLYKESPDKGAEIYGTETGASMP